MTVESEEQRIKRRHHRALFDGAAELYDASRRRGDTDIITPTGLFDTPIVTRSASFCPWRSWLVRRTPGQPRSAGTPRPAGASPTNSAITSNPKPMSLSPRTLL